MLSRLPYAGRPQIRGLWEVFSSAGGSEVARAVVQFWYLRAQLVSTRHIRNRVSCRNLMGCLDHSRGFCHRWRREAAGESGSAGEAGVGSGAEDLNHARRRLARRTRKAAAAASNRKVDGSGTSVNPP